MKLCLGSTPIKSLNIRKLDVDTNDATKEKTMYDNIYIKNYEVKQTGLPELMTAGRSDYSGAVAGWYTRGNARRHCAVEQPDQLSNRTA